jgi:hypothetical protein
MGLATNSIPEFLGPVVLLVLAIVAGKSVAAVVKAVLGFVLGLLLLMFCIVMIPLLVWKQKEDLIEGMIGALVKVFPPALWPEAPDHLWINKTLNRLTPGTKNEEDKGEG